MGKFVNDSVQGNCILRPVKVRGNIHLCLFAKVDIESGGELRYSYGVSGLPWRKVVIGCYRINVINFHSVSFNFLCYSYRQIRFHGSSMCILRLFWVFV